MLTSVASIIVTIVVLGSILGCGFILWNQSRVKLPKGKVETTGHEWDGLEEYNNPLPKWWMGLFWITVVFALAYVFLYPALGNYKGVLDWSSTGQWQKEVNKADEQYGPLFAKYAQTPITDLAQDPQAIEVGKRLYLTYCYQCHGSDARGAKGFPNLYPIPVWRPSPMVGTASCHHMLSWVTRLSRILPTTSVRCRAWRTIRCVPPRVKNCLPLRVVQPVTVRMARVIRPSVHPT